MPENTDIILNSVLRLDKKISLYEMHDDLANLVKAEHPELYNNIKGHRTYHAVSEHILDSYKNVMHILLLNKSDKVQESTFINPFSMLSNIHLKYNIDQSNNRDEDIYEKIISIIDNHFNTLSKTEKDIAR